ncbi:MAG: hypothetical protein HQL03_12465 [Nitrospirae bacterium]|nr:hypothetical protein [Nitrospirota bacterium]MBF0592722.1 hypothetical protein [Nitrospirota bacterium]
MHISYDEKVNCNRHSNYVDVGYVAYGSCSGSRGFSAATAILGATSTEVCWSTSVTALLGAAGASVRCSTTVILGAAGASIRCATTATAILGTTGVSICWPAVAISKRGCLDRAALRLGARTLSPSPSLSLTPQT